MQREAAGSAIACYTRCVAPTGRRPDRHESHKHRERRKICEGGTPRPVSWLQMTLAPNTAGPTSIPLWSTTMKSDRICAGCGAPFTPLLHIPHQRFCSAKACQRARRRAWQHQRMRVDPDYRENQIRAQASWRARHPDYWRHYRETHPAYRDRNCAMQRRRNAQRTASAVANMDVWPAHRPLASGFYILRNAVEAGVAKMNAWTVHIAVLSEPRPVPA